MGSGDKGARFGVPSLGEFNGEELLIPDLGDCIHLSTRVNLGTHSHGAILHWLHQVSIEGYLTI